MSSAFSLIVILLAFAALIFFAYKGFSTIYLAAICGAFVALCSGINVYEALVGPFMEGVGSLVTQLFLIFILSILFGQIYNVTQAGASIGMTLMNIFGRKASGDRQRTIAIYICIVIGFLLCFGGIDTFCAIFAQYPIVIALQKRTNIPRRYMIGLITSGAAAASMCPGAPVVFNYLPMQALGTTTTAGLIPGIIGTVVMILLCGTYLSRSVNKSVARGEVFEYGTMQAPPEVDAESRPNIVISLIPLLVVVILYNLTSLLEPALCVGIILALILLGKYIQPGPNETRGQTLINTFSASGRTASESIFLTSIIFGFAMIVVQTSGYELLTNFVLRLPIPEPLICVVAIAILVGLTCAPPAGLTICAPLLANNLSMAPAAIHRIIAAGTTTLDTLPYAGPILVMLNLAGLKHKDAYFPAFVCSVINTMIATLVMAILFIIFPGIA